MNPQDQSIATDLGQAVTGLGLAETRLNADPNGMTDDELRDYKILVGIVSQLQALAAKYGAVGQ